jgi:hypothetical protein
MKSHEDTDHVLKILTEFEHEITCPMYVVRFPDTLARLTRFLDAVIFCAYRFGQVAVRSGILMS